MCKALLSHLLTAQASGCVSGPRGRVAVGLLGALGFLAGALLILDHLNQLSLVL